MGAPTFVGLYLAATGVWLLLTLASVLRRLLAGRKGAELPPGLHVYELARLARGWAGMGDVLLVKLLGDGVVAREEPWEDVRDGRRGVWFELVTLRDADRDGHPLEQRFVDAVRAAGGSAESAERELSWEARALVEDRLVGLGLLHDDRRRWWLACLGWALCWTGVIWGVARMVAYGPSGGDATHLAFTVGLGLFVPAFLAMPDPVGGAKPTRVARTAVDRERARRPLHHPPPSVRDVLAAVALHGVHRVAAHVTQPADPDVAARLVEVRHVRAYREWQRRAW